MEEEGKSSTIRTPLSDSNSIYDEPFHNKGLGQKTSGCGDYVHRFKFDHILTLGGYDLKGYTVDSVQDPPMSPAAKYNPLFWIPFALKGTFISFGYWYHRMLGQGGPVRPDETLTEKAVRFQWMFMMSGILVVDGLVSLVQFVVGILSDEGNFTGEAIFSAGLWTAMALGNAYGYKAMKDQSDQKIKLFIAGFAAFTFALVLFFIMQGIVYYFIADDDDQSDIEATAIVTRALTCMLYLVLTVQYVKLWDFYPRAPDAETSDTRKALCVGVLIFVLFGLGTVVSQDWLWNSV